jgi:hypothetical protein
MKPRSAATTRRVIRERASVASPDGCWIWPGYVKPNGYGEMTWLSPEGVRVRGPHRVSYWVHKGPIADGLTIDHLCRTRACCNPDHLEAVTSRENVMRAPSAPAAINAAKTECPQGHPYDEANTKWVPTYKGRKQRMCRICWGESNRAAQRKRRARLKAAKAAA